MKKLFDVHVSHVDTILKSREINDFYIFFMFYIFYHNPITIQRLLLMDTILKTFHHRHLPALSVEEKLELIYDS